MKTVENLAMVWANMRYTEHGKEYFVFSKEALDVFTQKVVQECIEGFHTTRIEPSIEKYLCKRLGIE